MKRFWHSQFGEPLTQHSLCRDLQPSPELTVLLGMNGVVIIHAQTTRSDSLWPPLEVLKSLTRQELFLLTNKMLHSLLILFNGVWLLPPELSKLPWIRQICRFDSFPDCSSSKWYKSMSRGVNICLLKNFKLVLNLSSVAAGAVILDNCFVF